MWPPESSGGPGFPEKGDLILENGGKSLKKEQRLLNATRLLADCCILRHGSPDPNLDGPALFSVLWGRKKKSFPWEGPQVNLICPVGWNSWLNYSPWGLELLICVDKAFRPFHCFSLRRYAYLNIKTPGGQNKKFNRNTSFWLTGEFRLTVLQQQIKFNWFKVPDSTSPS